MTKNKFKVGDRVAASYDEDTGKLTSKIVYDVYGDSVIYGEVVSVVSKDVVKVLWDKDYEWHNAKVYDVKTGRQCGYEPRDMNINNILPAAEAEEKSKELEKEFSKIEKEIKEKMIIVSDLIDQSNRLAESIGSQLSHFDAACTLLGAMRKCGWRTSSLNC